MEDSPSFAVAVKCVGAISEQSLRDLIVIPEDRPHESASAVVVSVVRERPPHEQVLSLAKDPLHSLQIVSKHSLYQIGDLLRLGLVRRIREVFVERIGVV